MFIPVLDGLRIARHGPSRPRRRPDRVRGNKAYSGQPCKLDYGSCCSVVHHSMTVRAYVSGSWPCIE